MLPAARGAKNNKADGVNVTPITVLTSIGPELLGNLINMEEIETGSVDDCTDESVMEYLESTRARYASVTAEVLAKVSFTMSALTAARGAKQQDGRRQRNADYCCGFN
jgi:hypothetical protein